MNEKDRLVMCQQIMLELRGMRTYEKNDMEIEPNPCWSGYEPIGLKPDGSPNCVPIKENQSKVKEGFPIPSPSGESESEFISKCMSQLNEEFPDQSQRAAVCYKAWRGE